MSELLVPIAISSQLDVTGEERIHAAKYNPTIRISYVPSPTLFQVLVAQGGQGFLVASFDPDTLTKNVLAYHDEPEVYYQSRPFMLGEHYAIPYAWSAEDSPAVAVYSRAGAVFTLVDSIDNDATREFCGAVKLSESRFIALFTDPVDATLDCYLCNFDGAAITVVDSELAITETHGVPDYLQSVNCQGDAIFQCTGAGSNRFLICKMSGDVLTTSFSTVGPASNAGSGLAAIGDKIATGKGQIYQYDGSDMTSVQATTSTGICMTDDGTRFFSGGFGLASYWRLASSPYTKTVHATTYEGTSGGGGGYIFVPGDDQLNGANEHAVLQFDSGAFVKLMDFQFDEITAGDMDNLFATVVKVP